MTDAELDELDEASCFMPQSWFLDSIEIDPDAWYDEAPKPNDPRVLYPALFAPRRRVVR